MTRKIHSIAAAALFALIACAAPAAFAQAQEQPGSTLKATHGDWEIRCDAENAAACLMTQVGKRADGQPVVRVSLRKTPGAKGPNGEAIASVMQIDAPLGVLLTAGIALAIDGREIGRGAYKVCDGRACIASEPLADPFVSQLKAGSSAKMTLVGINGEKAEVTISLSGFTKAYDSL